MKHGRLGYATTAALIAALYFQSSGEALAEAFCGWVVPGKICPDLFSPPACTDCSCPPGSGAPGGLGARGGNPSAGGGQGCRTCAAAAFQAMWNARLNAFRNPIFSVGAAGGMTVYGVSEPYTSLQLEDSPAFYAPSHGAPVQFHLSYRQRGAIAEDSSVFGVGANWSCSFRSCLVDLTGNTPGWLRLNKAGAGLIDYTNGVTQYRDGSILTGSGTSYQITYATGATDTFQKVYTDANGTNFYFLTAQSDPSGATTTYSYSTTPGIIQLLYVVDCDNKTNTLAYTNASFPLQISSVTDPFNRTCVLQYDPTSGYLSNIVDVFGLQSSLIYDSGTRASWVTNLTTTTYGSTSFAYGGCDAESGTFFTGGGAINRSVLVTLPNGGNELYVYRQDCSAFMSATYSPTPSTSPLANTLDNVDQYNRNSFHWGPLQYSHLSSTFLSTLDPTNLTSGDYLIGHLSHWLTDPTTTNQPSPTLSLERAPSPDGSTPGQLTWYDYDGKTAGNNFAGTNALPSFVALVLPDTTTRFTHFSRGAHSQVTQDISTYTAPDGSVALRTNTYIYSANSVDLLQQIGPKNEQIVSNYFAAGNTFHQPDATYDALNQQTTFTYNANRQLISMVSPAGLTTTNIYFTSGTDINRLQTTVDLEITRTNSFTYTNGLVFTRTDERRLITTNYWDNLQRLTRMDYPDGTSISNLYTALDLTATMDRLTKWSYTGYNQVRQKIAETNANGVVTRYGYCECGALLSVTNAWNFSALSAVTTFNYDIQGNRTNTVSPDGFTVTNWFNPLGQVTNTGDGWGQRSFTYNNQGLQVSSANAFGTEQTILYGTEDRPVHVTDANNVTVTNSFDPLNRLISRHYPDNSFEYFGYSASGLTGYTNQIGESNFFAYDAAGRRIFETNADNQLLQFSYNPAGDLTNLVDGKSQSTRWGIDQYGRVTNKLDQAGTEVLRFTYDAESRILSRWSAAKGTTFYTNDALGNLISIKYPSSVNAISFQYDPLNRLTNMVDSVGTTAYGYTKGNQLFTEDGPFVSDTVTNTYLNRLRTALALQQPAGLWTNGFGYDAAKRLTNVTSQAGSFSYTYVAGLPSLLVRKLLLPNTSYITNNFDSRARLLNTSLKNSANNPLDSYAYIYDPADERTNLTRADATTVAFKYDPIGQLTVADSSVNTEDRGYLYDAAWNLNTRTNNGVTTAFAVDNKNQLTSQAGISCTYDANGNLTQVGDPSIAGGIVYNYDDENRLIEIYTNYNPTARPLGPTGGTTAWLTDFAYDGLGRLRKRTEFVNGSSTAQSTTIYIYDGMRVIQERNFTNNVPTVAYTRGNDLSGSLEGAGGIGGLLARSSSYLGGNWSTHYFYFADGGGNITYMVDTSQALAASYRYDPFGNTISSSGPVSIANLYRFSSKEVHANSGMYYYLYRFYDPNLQRWINRDPLGENGGGNLYGYVRNEPIGDLDPNGQGVISSILRGLSKALGRRLGGFGVGSVLNPPCLNAGITPKHCDLISGPSNTGSPAAKTCTYQCTGAYPTDEPASKPPATTTVITIPAGFECPADPDDPPIQTPTIGPAPPNPGPPYPRPAPPPLPF